MSLGDQFSDSKGATSTETCTTHRRALAKVTTVVTCARQKRSGCRAHLPPLCALRRAEHLGLCRRTCICAHKNPECLGSQLCCELLGSRPNCWARAN